MKLRKLSTVAAIAAAALVGGLSAAQADPPNNFASFYQSGTTNAFVFTTGAAGTLMVANTTPITFVFQSPNTYGAIGQAIAGTLTMSANVSNPESTSGPFIVQSLNNISFAFTSTTPVAGHTNLLSISGGTGSIDARTNGYTYSVTADTANAPTPDALNFQSDFLSFGTTTDENYNFSLSGNSPASTSNSYLNSFNAAGTGIFASAPLPSPEPGTLVSLAVLSGCLGIGLLARKRLSVNA